MKITVLMDNTVSMSKLPFIGEHGLSLLLEIEKKKILLDAGQSVAIIQNMGLLGLKASELDALVISHGHFDHTGGLLPVLRYCQKQMPVYAHPDIFAAHYSLRGSEREYIGIPFKREEAESWGAAWRFSQGPCEIAPNLWFSGEIPRKTSFEQGSASFSLLGSDGCCCHDDILDDTVLYYAGEKGLVVLAGCAHAGLVNAVYHGFEVTGKTKLLGWVGGTHLGPASQEQRQATVEMLAEFSPEFIATGHCTGLDMLGELKKNFGAKVIPAVVGAAIEC